MQKTRSWLDMSRLAKRRFFSSTIYHPKVRECISGENENYVIKVLEMIGYHEFIDFVRQYPIGEKFVLDFAFVKEQVALEIDGQTHRYKKQRKNDKDYE